MRGRPNLYTDYRKESAVLPNLTQKFWFIVLLFFAFSLCLVASDYWVLLLTTSFLIAVAAWGLNICLLYTSPSPRDRQKSRMPSSA